MTDVKLSKVQQVVGLLAGMNTDELNEIRTHLNYSLSIASQKKLRRLAPGMKVRFDGGNRGIRTGRVSKINRKTVTVKDDNGVTTWRVAPSLITVVE